MYSRFPLYIQPDTMDCGPTCLRMIAKHYGKSYSLQYFRENSHITREGVSLSGISEAAELVGFKTIGARITLEQLSEVTFPCILHWNQKHFVVCYDIKGKGEKCRYKIADPASGKMTYTAKEFRKHWLSTKMEGHDMGIILLLEPTPHFFSKNGKNENRNNDLMYFLNYMKPYRKEIFQLTAGTLTAMGLSYATPFLSQATIDVGIKNYDLNFILLILIAQLVISTSQISIGFIQAWISLHINTRIDIALLSDYMLKLTKMPMRFFDTKKMGDILQRFEDHGRLKSFLMGNLVNVFLSTGTFIVFGTILGIYNVLILTIFLIGNILYIVWVLLFMPYRRRLDQKRFSISAKLQNNMVQFVEGMQEIKLNNIEKERRWQWEYIQASLYKISIRVLKLEQIQSVGSLLFSSTANILISFYAAKMVITGEISLGMMMAMMFIIGQVSDPVKSFIDFAHGYQDARLSLERLNDIHGQDDEDKDIEGKLNYLPDNKDIVVENLTFSYSGSEHDFALQDISTVLPENKTTAIVGASGSGKTTLIKLLQGLYVPLHGNITIGNTPLNQINPHFWRSKTGTVLQDSYIFSDTIAKNIAVGTDDVDIDRLKSSVTIANIKEFINRLPLNYSTKIGMEGIGLSQGQRQRILIARAVYKNPEYIFFDEATNALDTTNENIIVRNLHQFYKGRTVVIAAHRLSTIKDADNIIVLDKGKIVEQGTHESLTALKGHYFHLIKNQLEL